MISYLHCYSNSRPDVDWNTCGQAAIATITDYWSRNPYNLSRTAYDYKTSRYYWNDGAAIDAIKNGGYGPDVVFGWGTTGGRMSDALRSYGLNASVGYSGFGFWGWEGLWSSLQNYLYWNRPVPVMLDIGVLGGPAWGVHWAIAYRVADGRVYLGNMSGLGNASPTTNEFLSAWQCWFLPYGFNHCGVYV
jgi:hypothetical protein